MPRSTALPRRSATSSSTCPTTSDSERRRALVHGHQKLIAFGDDKAFELFDLDADPTEEHPVTKGEDFRDMLLRYRAFEKTVKDVSRPTLPRGVPQRRVPEEGRWERLALMI